MATSILKHYTAVLLISCLVTHSLCAEPEQKHFQSNNRSLTLSGVWAVQRNDGSFQASTRMKNAGSVPLKAFRATLYKSNDFGEGTKVFDIEYSSESEYLAGNAKGRPEAHHVIQPGETVFYNFVSSSSGDLKKFFAAISYFQMALVSHGHSEKDAQSGMDEVAAEGSFFLKVTAIVPSD